MIARVLLLLAMGWGLPATAVESIKETKSSKTFAGRERIESDFQMTVIVEDGEFVLLTYREYEGAEDGPASPAKLIIEQMIRPAAGQYQEILSAELYRHAGSKASLPTKATSNITGFGRKYSITELPSIGSSSGMRKLNQRPVYVSKKFKFGDDRIEPTKRKSVRFTLEVISKAEMLEKLKTAGLPPPLEPSVNWRVLLPERP